MAHKIIKRVSVLNLKLFRPMKTELLAKGVGEFSVMLYGKWADGHSFVHQHGCHNLNLWRFSNSERP